MKLGFLDGIVVGAWDNLRENRLGERLLREGALTQEDTAEIDQRMRDQGERFIEAAIALDLIDEDAALQAIDDQTRDRLMKVATLDEGDIRLIHDDKAVEQMAGAPVDLLEAVLQAFLTRGSRRLNDRLCQQLANGTLMPTRDFEPGLIGFATLRPTSALPGQFFAGPRSVDELKMLDEHVLEELVALRMAGMLRGPKDPQHDRMVPHPLQLADDGGDVDEAMIKKVRRAVLRARGRDLYAFLRVDREASHDEVQEALRSHELELGKDALDLGKLGPARDAARELWLRLDEAQRILLDGTHRKAYDATLPPIVNYSDDEGTEESVEIEVGFLKGRVLLAQEDFTGARIEFEQAIKARPDDVEFKAFLGWVNVLDESVERGKGEAILKDARQHHPQAVRPLLFLGLAADRSGRQEEAQQWLQEALMIDPDNREVQQALAAVMAAKD